MDRYICEHCNATIATVMKEAHLEHCTVLHGFNKNANSSKEKPLEYGHRQSPGYKKRNTK